MPLDHGLPSDGAASAGMRQFSRNSLFGTVAGVLSALSSVLASIIIAQALGVEATGVVAFAVWVAMVASAVVDLGVQASLARYLPELSGGGRDAEAEALAGMLWRWLAATGAVALAGFAAAIWWRYSAGSLSPDDATLWGLVGITCVLQALAGFTYGYLRGKQRFDRLALLTIVSLALQLAAVAALALAWGSIGAVAGYALGSVVPAALSLRHATVRSNAPLALKRRVRRYALYAWAGALSSTFVWSRAELFFLQRSSDSRAVGLFTVAVTLANLASQGALLLTVGLLPYFAQSFGKGAVAEMKAGYAAATRILAFVMLPASLGLTALLPVALPMIYGPAFAAAVPAATVLLVAAAFTATASVANTLVMAMDRSDIVFASGIAAAILSIAAGLTIIPIFGLMGAAWSRTVVQMVALAIGIGFVWRQLGFPLPTLDLAKLLLAATLCAAAARGVIYLLHGLAGLAAAIAAGALVYLIAVRSLRALQPSDAARLRGLCVLLPERLGVVVTHAIALLAPAPRGGQALAMSWIGQWRSAGRGN